MPAEEEKNAGKAEAVASDKPGKPRNMAPIYMAVVAIVCLAVGYFAGGSITGGIVADSGSQAVGAKVVDFLQSRLSMGYPGIQVELAGVGNFENISGIYEVDAKITYNGQTQVVPYYATKDGNYILSGIGDLNEQLPADTSGEPAASTGIPKSDRPVVELFVMSHCPYGTQAEKGIIPAVELLEDKIDFSIKFVYYAMHGKTEIDEETRQYCIQKEQGTKYLPYLNCFLGSGNPEQCLVEAAIDTAKLNSCVAAADAEFSITENLNDKDSWLSGYYPLFDVNKADNEKYGIGGSPTLVINGQTVQTSRDSASMLSAICSAFTAEPSECSMQLSSAQPSTGFGYGTASGDSSGGTCG